ncbi:hypothetical protein LCGC14_0567030 [marine sediment metagenome]|uniref:Uncharacterized protein n=1 Tax=marine sediment metagenome TaxID=412755 RepID=A0A0F9U6Q5_9ZZZZ
MTNDWYTSDGVDLLRAKKMGLFRNADAKLEAADVLAEDDLIAYTITEPVGVAEPIGASNSMLPKYRTSRFEVGTFGEIKRLQTARDLFPAMGVCVTTEATPNIHALTIRAGTTRQIPLNMGRHLQRLNPTVAENEIIDIFGMLLQTYHAECTEIGNQVAIQSLNWISTFTKNSSVDLLTPATVTDEPFKWNHFTFPTYTYNSEPIQADIIGWSFDVVNSVIWVVLDSTGFYTKGKYLPFQFISTTIELNPYGHNPFELIRTKLESYITDVDLTVKCARNATTDYIQWTHDKCYTRPFTISANKQSGAHERYFLQNIQLNTGSLAIEAKDAYNKAHYEVS